MIEQMSPLTRKIVAVGLLVLLVLLASQYVIGPLVGGIAGQRYELSALRAREARLRATIQRPLPKASSVGPAQSVSAPNEAQATQRMRAMLAGDAAVAGAMLQLGPPCTPQAPPESLCVQIAVSGSEASISHFLTLVEHGVPVIRFRVWQLASGPGGDNQLHLTSRVLAAWRTSS